MSDWLAAASFYNRQRAENPSFDVIGDLFDSRKAWIELAERRLGWFDLVKIVRSVFNISIDEAHRMILDHSGFRRLVQQAIDTNVKCAKYARSGIRKGWLAGLAEMRGERAVIHLTWRAAFPRL